MLNVLHQRFEEYNVLHLQILDNKDLRNTCTLEPRYNTIRYNTNSDITRMRFGPQFFPNLPFFISLERKYVFQTC